MPEWMSVGVSVSVDESGCVREWVCVCVLGEGDPPSRCSTIDVAHERSQLRYRKDPHKTIKKQYKIKKEKQGRLGRAVG